MRLARIAYAGITAEGLRPGQWRHLGVDELVDLKRAYGVPKRVRPQELPERTRHNAPGRVERRAGKPVKKGAAPRPAAKRGGARNKGAAGPNKASSSRPNKASSSRPNKASSCASEQGVQLASEQGVQLASEQGVQNALEPRSLGPLLRRGLRVADAFRQRPVPLEEAACQHPRGPQHLLA